MRRYVVPTLLALPSLLAFAAYGCGSSEPPLEDLCGWLQDPTNCYRRFSQDVQQNGPFQCTQLSGTTNEVPQIGQFLGRDKLDKCFLQSGGIINFGTAVDLTMLPPKDVAFTFMNANNTECGSVDWKTENNFSITIDGSLTDDAGAPAQVGVYGGTFSSVETAAHNKRYTETVTCPTGESHYFDTYEVAKCPQYAAIQPQAQLKIIQGGLDDAGNAGGTGTNGAIEFSLFLPPPGGDLYNAKPTEVKYFTCLFPAPPDICANGIQDDSETDVDCGGTYCATRCAGMQKCILPTDCNSGVCEPVMGLKQCIGDGAGAGGAGGGN